MSTRNWWVLVFILLLFAISEARISQVEKHIARDIAQMKQEVTEMNRSVNPVNIAEYHNDGTVSPEQFQSEVIADISKRVGLVETKIGR